MPTFETPEPISVTIDLKVGIGAVSVVASDRTDTVVEVTASDPSSKQDNKVAAQTSVDFSDGTLLIKLTKPWHQQISLGPGGSVDVRVQLPAGSRVRGELAHGGFHCEGRLGDSSFLTYHGNIRVDRAGPLRVSTWHGEISVGRADIHLETATRGGTVRIAEIDGTAILRTTSGYTEVGESTGHLHIQGANGDIVVERAHVGVVARAARGNIRIAEVIKGSVDLETGAGDLEVGISEGTAAWLDVKSETGRVRNSLDAADGPQQTDETVEVRAHAYVGDVHIHRS